MKNNVLIKLKLFVNQLLLVALLTCLFNTLYAQDTYAPQPYKVSLKLDREGLDAGLMVFSLSKTNNTWQAQTMYKPSLLAQMFGLDKLAETTNFIYVSGRFLPFQYLSGQDNILFDYSKSVYYNFKSTHKLGDIPALAQTSQSMLSVMAHDIVAQRNNKNYPVFANNKFSNHHLSFQYNQTITIDETTYQVSKATLSKNNKATIFWLAKEWNWIPIKMEKYKNDNLVLQGTLHKIEYSRANAQ